MQKVDDEKRVMDRKQKMGCVIVDEGAREIRRYRDAYYADFF